MSHMADIDEIQIQDMAEDISEQIVGMENSVAVAEVRAVVNRKKGESEAEEGSRMRAGGVRGNMGQWKRTVVIETVTGLMASVHANIDLDTKNRKAVPAGKKEGLAGGRSSGAEKKGKGKERQRDATTPPREESQEPRQC